MKGEKKKIEYKVQCIYTPIVILVKQVTTVYGMKFEKDLWHCNWKDNIKNIFNNLYTYVYY